LSRIIHKTEWNQNTNKQTDFTPNQEKYNFDPDVCPDFRPFLHFHQASCFKPVTMKSEHCPCVQEAVATLKLEFWMCW